MFEGINFPETSRFGISGDMYGGLNALFSGFAFICFIYALYQQRLELQLQRRELSLQRRELKAQCREQERQANEFELQNKLMKIQQFESFFYNQIPIIRRLQDEIQIYGDSGRDAINMLYVNLSRVELHIKSVISDIERKKREKFFVYPLDMSRDAYAIIKNNNEIWNFDVLVLQVNMIRPWVDSLYNLLLFIIKNKNLNIEQKTKYLEILKYSFLCEDWQTLHSLGRLLNYNKIVEYLLDKELFEKDESIEKISEENIRFLQKEMKLKSNLSLNSCEIEL
ncbi:hypothetical protein AKMU_14990 [Akkermansia muciniphila]|nr:hypothetical protein AKMU_14990 [Akkermansia muciniphila]